jgi:hypothetical protein
VGAQQILGLAFAMLGMGLRREYFVDKALFTLALVVRKYGQKEGVMAGKTIRWVRPLPRTGGAL